MSETESDEVVDVEAEEASPDKEADIEIVTKTDDEGAYIAMDLADEEQVLAEISGRTEALEHYVYSFEDRAHRTITGLSLAGTREAARAMALQSIGEEGQRKQLMQPTIDPQSIVIEETDDLFRARATARDQRSGFTWTGFAEEEKTYIPRDGDKRLPRPFAYVIATSKAQRNAYRGLLPEHWIIQMIKRFMAEGGRVRQVAPPAEGDGIPFGKYKGMTLEEIWEENPGYVTWGTKNLDEPWRARFVAFLAEHEGEGARKVATVKVGDRHYPAGTINKKWQDRLTKVAEEAGMVHPHFVNHLKKHYGVEELAALTYAQAIQLGRHLTELKGGSDIGDGGFEPEDYEPYGIPDELTDRAAELEIEGWDFGEFIADHVMTRMPPNMPIKGPVEKALTDFLDRLQEGEDVELVTKAFDEQLDRILNRGDTPKQEEEPAKEE